eukprot:14948198-Ditylum_brightwellii.AAC.1
METRKMTKNNGVDCCTNAAKYQGGKLLPYFRHNYSSCEQSQMYHWEIHLQFYTTNTTAMNDENENGNKVRIWLIEL